MFWKPRPHTVLEHVRRHLRESRHAITDMREVWDEPLAPFISRYRLKLLDVIEEREQRHKEMVQRFRQIKQANIGYESVWEYMRGRGFHRDFFRPSIGRLRAALEGERNQVLLEESYLLLKRYGVKPERLIERLVPEAVDKGMSRIEAGTTIRQAIITYQQERNPEGEK